MADAVFPGASVASANYSYACVGFMTVTMCGVKERRENADGGAILRTDASHVREMK